MNKGLSENLQIRVGVNTGGPIVAGVLGGIGSGKPMFEILGPPINIAQQMEYHGVPMNVYIREWCTISSMGKSSKSLKGEQ
jgi:class 3 adenylate cyclase